MLDRARILGAAMRVAYMMSAAMPGMLPRVAMRCDARAAGADLPKELAALSSERLFNRLKQLARIIGRSPVISCSL